VLHVFSGANLNPDPSRAPCNDRVGRGVRRVDGPVKAHLPGTFALVSADLFYRPFVNEVQGLHVGSVAGGVFGAEREHDELADVAVGFSQ
jgi:hypothetical protein